MKRVNCFEKAMGSVCSRTLFVVIVLAVLYRGHQFGMTGFGKMSGLTPFIHKSSELHVFDPESTPINLRSSRWVAYVKDNVQIMHWYLVLEFSCLKYVSLQHIRQFLV